VLQALPGAVKATPALQASPVAAPVLQAPLEWKLSSKLRTAQLRIKLLEVYRQDTKRRYQNDTSGRPPSAKDREFFPQ